MADIERGLLSVHPGGTCYPDRQKVGTEWVGCVWVLMVRKQLGNQMSKEWERVGVGSSSWVWLTPLEASVLLREGQSQPGRGQDTSPRPQVLHRTAGDAELREALTQHP